MARRVWRCPECRVSLGAILGDTKLPDGRFIPGALSLDRATSAIVTEEPIHDGRTNLAGTLVECRYCGKLKRWYGEVRIVTIQ